MNILAIDPGASGGLAWHFTTGQNFAVKMPKTTGDLIEFLTIVRSNLKANGDGPLTVFLEDMVKYTGKNTPSSAIAVYARNFGIVEGAVQALGLRLELVRAQTWQKELGLGKSDGNKTAWKNKLKAMAQRLYPDITVTLAVADALLLLEYAIRTTRNTQPS